MAGPVSLEAAEEFITERYNGKERVHCISERDYANSRRLTFEEKIPFTSRFNYTHLRILRVPGIESDQEPGELEQEVESI